MHVQPYLFFEGRCEEALMFYRDRLGAEIEMMMRYGEEPASPTSRPRLPERDDKIMHAAFRLGETFVMASDGNCSGQSDFKGVSLSISTATLDEARSMFDGLSDGGQPFMPLSETFFSPAFGMLKDRFGVSWMVMCAPQVQA